MNSIFLYFSSFWKGLSSLLIGMGTTLKVFFRKKTTETYPSNRKTVHIAPRFRGHLYMPLDENGQHRCVACGLCQINCPNDTIQIHSRHITTEEGKTRKVLLRYEYDLGCCLFCQICVRVCPHKAIDFTPNYENAVFNREKLILTLNPDACSDINVSDLQTKNN